jgi:hypothetical protein
VKLHDVVFGLHGPMDARLGSFVQWSYGPIADGTDGA